MKANVQPGRLWTNLNRQPPEIPLDHHLFMRLHDAVVVKPLHWLDIYVLIWLIFVLILFEFFHRLVFTHHKTHLDGLVHDPDQ